MVYIDTSVIVTLLTVEPKTENIKTWFANLTKPPIASDWLITEFASAIAFKVRTAQISEVIATQVHQQFDVLIDGGLRLTPITRNAFNHAANLVKQHQYGLRAGDALHLATALELNAKTIATLDNKQAENSLRLGLKVLRFN